MSEHYTIIHYLYFTMHIGSIEQIVITNMVATAAVSPPNTAVTAAINIATSFDYTQ